jgi:hypothetical protein
MKFMNMFGIVLWTFSAWSCDVCGGVSGNASIGLLASTQFHTIGIKSSLNTYRSYLNGIVHSREYIAQGEVIARWQPHARWQISANIPYQVGRQKRDLGSDFIQGLGDPRILVNHVLVHQKDSNQATRNFLSLGLGIKAPWGRRAPASSMIRNLYPSTGAWNFSTVLLFTNRLTEHVSLQQEGIYTYKMRDASGYRYGNTYSYAVTVVWNKSLGIGRLLVGPGLQLERFGASTEDGLPVSGYNNQGFVFESQVSVNYLSYNWLWGLNVIQPLQQNFNQGSMKQGIRVSCTLSYLITKNSKK